MLKLAFHFSSGALVPRPDSPQLQSWQQQINSGFDKLVAFAAEVDKRRKSTETSSPRQDSSHLMPRSSSSTNYTPPFGGGYSMNGPGSTAGTNGGIPSPVTNHHHSVDRRMGNVGGLPGRLMESNRIAGHYSPHSPHSLLPPLTSPQGRPPTPQSPHIPLRTPPITSPPPTPSPDLRCEGVNSRLPSPPPPAFYDHHFKKKYLHKERASPSEMDHHQHHHPGINRTKADRISPQQQMDIHHHHQQQQLQAKFRPKGKDWQWRNSREPHPPPHNNTHPPPHNNTPPHHLHYQQRAMPPYPHHSNRQQVYQQNQDMPRNNNSNLPPNNYYNHA